ncbi:MAG: hypothetical protein KHY79_00565 [Clostridiales bacterium]|nr:hypothetical protein [Clostridiales bacterium]
MKRKKRKLILFFLCMIALSGTGKEAAAAGVRLDGYFDRSPGLGDGYITEEFIEEQEEKKLGVYSLQELEDYFSYETLEEYAEQIERWDLKNIEEQFPEMVHRFDKDGFLMYSVCEVEEGGRYFAMQVVPNLYMTDREVANSHRESRYSFEVANGTKPELNLGLFDWGRAGIYLTKLNTEEDFAKIIPGWSTIQEVKEIDPYLEEMPASGNSGNMFSMLADGRVLHIEKSGEMVESKEILESDTVYRRKVTLGIIQQRDLEPFLDEEGKAADFPTELTYQ